MAFHNNARIVNNGLVFLVDAANPNSYPGSGTVLTDIIGSRVCTLNSAVIGTTTPGIFTFNGSTDHILLPNDIGYNTDVSVIAFYKKTSNSTTGGYHIVCGGSPLEISIQQTSEWLRTGVSTDARFVSNAGIGLNNFNWHSVGLTYLSASRTKTGFIDGVGQTQYNVPTGALDASFADRRLGQFGAASYYLTGAIALYAVYDRALNATEMMQNHDALKSRFGL